MKDIYFIVLFFGILSLSIFLTLFAISSTATPKNLARVYSMYGVETYVLNEPLRTYEVVYGGEKNTLSKQFTTPKSMSYSISSRVGRFARKAVKRAQEEGKQIDAVIYTGGNTITAVKYTDEPTIDNKGVARVQRLNGIPIFALCDPLSDFSVVDDQRERMASAAKLPHKNIKRDLMLFAIKYKKMFNQNQVDALYYTRGKLCDGIVF